MDVNLDEKIVEKMIAEKIMKHMKSENYDNGYYIMTYNGRMIWINEYVEMVAERKITRDNAIAIFVPHLLDTILSFQYPFLCYFRIVLDAYISKLGILGGYYSAPATYSLKYAAVRVELKEYVAIEVIDLDNAVHNTNLRVVANDVLNNVEACLPFFSDIDILPEYEYNKIYDKYKLQKLFAGYNFSEAENILYSYYYDHEKSLEKEVVKIANAYNEIFKPYRLWLNTKTWSEVEC